MFCSFCCHFYYIELPQISPLPRPKKLEMPSPRPPRQHPGHICQSSRDSRGPRTNLGELLQLTWLISTEFLRCPPEMQTGKSRRSVPKKTLYLRGRQKDSKRMDLSVTRSKQAKKQLFSCTIDHKTFRYSLKP